MSEILSVSEKMFEESGRQLKSFSERLVKASTWTGLRLAWQESSQVVDCVIGAVDESFYKGFVDTSIGKLEQFGLDFSLRDERLMRLMMSAKYTSGSFRGVSAIGHSNPFMADFYRILTGADNSNTRLSLRPTEELVDSHIDGLREKVTEYLEKRGLNRFQVEDVKSPFWGFAMESYTQNRYGGVRVSMPTGLIPDSSLVSSTLISNFGNGELILRSVEVQSISSDPLSSNLERDTSSGLVLGFIKSLK